jgi:hypothetical protein
VHVEAGHGAGAHKRSTVLAHKPMLVMHPSGGDFAHHAPAHGARRGNHRHSQDLGLLDLWFSLGEPDTYDLHRTASRAFL